MRGLRKACVERIIGNSNYAMFLERLILAGTALAIILSLNGSRLLDWPCETLESLNVHDNPAPLGTCPLMRTDAPETPRD